MERKDPFMQKMKAQLANVGDVMVIERLAKMVLEGVDNNKPDKVLAALSGLKNIRLHGEEAWSKQVEEFAYGELEFRLMDMYSGLNAFTTQQKGAIRKAVQRMVEDKKLESMGRGYYRVIQGELIEMVFKRVEDLIELNIDWPFKIHEWYITYPKSVIVVAGTKDAGKTAFFLDFIKRNMHRHEIHYFNSEMGENEFSVRLNKHQDIKLDQWRFKAYERSDNFKDVIFPDAINIIDYIEENENLMKMGDKIKEIHERLHNGIAIVGLQKDFGATLGRGRAFTLQRPRLYLTMEYGPTKKIGKMCCLAAKNRRKEDDGLAGKEMEYHLFGGWKFKMSFPDWFPMVDDPYGQSYQKGSGRG